MPIPPVVAAGLIAGGGSILGGGLNSLGQRSANKANLQNSREQREWDLQMWKLNNEYNDPSAQMGRLEKAGLNPNLIYGNGSASTGLSSSYPKASVAHAENTMNGIANSIPMGLNMYMDMQLKSAQIDATKNQSDYTLQRTINEALNARLLSLGITGKDLSNQRAKALLPYATQAQEANIRRTNLVNQDMLYKINNLNPQRLRNAVLTNEGLDLSNKQKKFDLNYILPKKSQNMALQNSLASQQLTEMNPSLLMLRQTQNSILNLQKNLESRLNPYNLTSRDKPLIRMLGNIFGDWSPERKDRKILSW